MATTPPERFFTIAWLERRSARQRWIVGIVVGIYVLWRLLNGLAKLLLDRWWFDSVTDADVWSTKFWAQVQLLVGAGLFTALVLGGSVFVVLRLGHRTTARLHPFWARYHDRMGPGHRWLLVGIAIFFTYRISSAATQHWQEWLLYRHSVDLDRSVPGLGTDLGEHLFLLPFMSSTSSFVRQLLLLTLGVSIFGHFASGQLRWPGKGRTAHAALAHLVALLTAFFAAQALDYILVRRLMLGTNRVGAFDGPGFTQLDVTRPMLYVAAAAALIAGFAGVQFGRTRNKKPFYICTAVFVAVNLLGLVVAPALVQRYVVEPAEAARELDEIGHNLTATKTAYGLNQVDYQSDVVADGAVAPLTDPETDSLDKVPLFDQFQMASAFQVLAGTTGTRITDVDLDRYDVDDERQPVLIAARSSSRNDLPENGWVQEHLVYTHGNGVVVAPGDATDRDGRPDVVPLSDVISVTQPELYFGEGLAGWYALVGTDRVQQDGAEFDAETGIPMNSLSRRAVLALATGQPDPLLTSELTDETQLLYRRDVRERLHALAPFLKLDSDPYPVVSDGRIYWIVDAYTTADTYPYAQFADTSGVRGSSDLAGRSFNAVRGSVKAVVDAYDGTTTLYRTEVGGAEDPIIEAWDRVFPGLLRPIDELDPTLRDHLRYPSDLYVVQTNLLGRYHVDDAETLFNGSDRWTISAGAIRSVGDETVAAAPAVNLFWPVAEGDSDISWSAVRPFSPGASPSSTSARPELVALAVGDHDDPERLTVIELDPASTRQLSPPEVAQSAIDADPDLAEAVTLLNANGSQVQFGPMTPLIAGDGLIWTRPIIVIGTGPSSAPRLWGVTVVSNGLVGVGAESDEALTAAE